MLRSMKRQAGGTEHIVAHAAGFRVELTNLDAAVAALLAARVQGTPASSARLQTPTASQRFLINSLVPMPRSHDT
jgi:hypothetical protein